jgi:hypothetical protein
LRLRIVTCTGSLQCGNADSILEIVATT